MSKAFSIALLMVMMTATTHAQPSSDDVLVGLQKYETPYPNAGVRNWYVTQNLGPTGARGWMSGYGGNTHDTRRILVKSVEPGSPADGILLPYDIIVGAAVPPETPTTEWTTPPEIKPFESDARLALARAITWAETDDAQGKLQLLCERDGKTRCIAIQLPVLGAYAATAPHDCQKTRRIIAKAAAFAASTMPTDGDTNVPGALNALLLYASEDDRYLDLVRRSACKMSINHTINDEGHNTWRWGYMNLFLCEYYLATGDKRVLPTIAAFCDVIAKGQCNPGTWGHRGVPDFIPPGYGSMNQAGLVSFLSLILARQAGIEIDKVALQRSISFYGSYAGIGSIPYGDHAPARDATSNGKNGSAAVAFFQLGADPAAQWFSRLCASTDLNGFENGHTGNYFNQILAPLGASLSGRENYQAFWSRFNSYRDLARRWDGSFVVQPYPDVREGDLAYLNYIRFGPCWATGGFALSYLAGNNQLAILGRRDSVFASKPPGALSAALNLYNEKQFAACMDATDPLLQADNQRLQMLAEQLYRAAQRNLNSQELTLADMQITLAAGDLYKLRAQLQGIESILDPADDRLVAFRAVISDPAHAQTLQEGERYHKAVPGLDRIGMKGFEIYGVDPQKRLRHLVNLAHTGSSAYRRLATEFIKGLPPPPPITNTSLTQEPGKPSANGTAWNLLPEGSKLPTNWMMPGCDDQTWPPACLPSEKLAGAGTRYLRNTFKINNPHQVQALSLSGQLFGRMKVYLNGELIADFQKVGPEDNYEALLKGNTVKLFKLGDNTLAIELAPNPQRQKATVQLKAMLDI